MQRYITVCFSALLLAAGCKELDIAPFDKEKEGRSIYFPRQDSQMQKDTLFVGFGYSPVSVTDSVVLIPVRATGPLDSVQRDFTVSVRPGSSMKPGQHYEFVNNGVFFIPARQRTGYIGIRLKRTEDMLQDSVVLDLDLKTNEHFNTRLPYLYKPGDTVNLLHYVVMTDNKQGKPYLWTETGRNLAKYTNDYLGEYSRAKVLLIIEVMNLEPSALTNPNHFGKPIPFDYLQIWGSYMKYWLSKEKFEGRMRVDENGNEILMGKNA